MPIALVIPLFINFLSDLLFAPQGDKTIVCSWYNCLWPSVWR